MKIQNKYVLIYNSDKEIIMADKIDFADIATNNELITFDDPEAMDDFIFENQLTKPTETTIKE